MKLINIGFGNIVFANRLIAIVSPESAPVKRLVQDARDRGMLIDATYGRRTRAVLITDSDHIILSAVQPETVANRLNTQENGHSQSAPEYEDDDQTQTVAGFSIEEPTGRADFDALAAPFDKTVKNVTKKGGEGKDDAGEPRKRRRQ